MKVYLVRHGKAEQEADDDASRRLTKRGRESVDQVARVMADAGIRVPLIEHSHRVRARETAEILAESVDGKLREVSDIDAMDDVEPVAQRLESADADLMLVGHSPFMPRLASHLLTGDADQDLLHFRTASVACLERADDFGWMLEWFLPPDLA